MKHQNDIWVLLFLMLNVITDIVFGIRAGGSAVDIPPMFRNLEIGSCKKPPHFPDTKWYCIVVGGWNSYIRIINKPVGALSSKLRHLQLLGYKPVVVSYISWVMLVHDPFMVHLKLLSVLYHTCAFSGSMVWMEATPFGGTRKVPCEEDTGGMSRWSVLSSDIMYAVVLATNLSEWVMIL